MNYWYVPNKGLHKGEKPSGDAVEIPAATYHTCIENYSLYDISIEDGVFYARVNVEAYRRTALDQIKNTNYIEHLGTRYYDDELPYLSESYWTRSGHPCRLTQAEMIKLVSARNRKFGALHRRISEAECVDEIDAYARE